MMRTLMLLGALCFLLDQPLKAQSPGKGPIFSIGYFGVLGTHPGIKFSLQYPFLQGDPELEDLRLNQVLVGTSLLLYYHRRNQIGLGVNAEFGVRQLKLQGGNWEAFYGIGYLKTRLPNPVYTPDLVRGELRPGKPSRGHFMQSLSIGFGKTISEEVFTDFWSIRPTLFKLKPYNTKSTLNFAIDASRYFQ